MPFSSSFRLTSFFSYIFSLCVYNVLSNEHTHITREEYRERAKPWPYITKFVAPHTGATRSDRYCSNGGAEFTAPSFQPHTLNSIDLLDCIVLLLLLLLYNHVDMYIDRRIIIIWWSAVTNVKSLLISRHRLYRVQR